jgi:hypothetical protein
LSKSCQKVVKQLSKSCQKVVTKSCHHRTLKPKTRKTGFVASSKKKKRPRMDDERMMKKLGIRRLDATSSHLVKRIVANKVDQNVISWCQGGHKFELLLTMLTKLWPAGARRGQIKFFVSKVDSWKLLNFLDQGFLDWLELIGMEKVGLGLTGMDWNSRSLNKLTTKWNLKKAGGKPQNRISEENCWS